MGLQFVNQNNSNIHIWRRQMVSLTFGGIDEDVERMFLDLQPDILHKVLEDYKRTYGSKKHAYAKKTYPKWKSGEVFLSGEVCERLLAIVPRHLDFGTKYDLVVKLWRRQSKTHLMVTVSSDMQVDEAFQVVMRVIDSLKDKGIPEALVARLYWLAENDGKVAQNLFSQVLAHETEIIVGTIKEELQQILAVSSQLVGMPVQLQSQRQVNLPGATVQIVINDFNSSRKGGRARMAEEQRKGENQDPKQTGGSLVPAQNPTQSGQLAPIQNPQNLLDEALKRMPPEKQAEIMGKAADEALRLQIKRKENELDLDIVSDKIEQAGRIARGVAQNPDVDMTFETEHRSKQGDTRINVRSKSARSKGGCYVVTATYGETSPESVNVRRKCRRTFLLNPLLIIGWCLYKYYGPALARWSRSGKIAFWVSKVLVADPIIHATGSNKVLVFGCLLYLILLSMIGLILFIPYLAVCLVFRFFARKATWRDTQETLLSRVPALEPTHSVAGHSNL